MTDLGYGIFKTLDVRNKVKIC